MQLGKLITTGLLAGAALGAPAHADDRAEVSTSLFEEHRQGGLGGLTVVHPEADFGIDLGRYVNLDAGYSADAVSGATSTVYQVDAVSSATKFSDVRQEGTLGLGFQGRRSRINFSGTFGTERDYLSRQLGGSASIDLPGRNTTVALAYSHSFDQVCDKDNGMLSPLDRMALTGADPCDKRSVLFGKDTPGTTVWRDLAIDTAQIPINVTGNFAPRTEYEAKFSLPYVVAHALLYGSVRLNAFTAERIADPAIRNLMSKITLQADAEMTAKFPGLRSARVAITMADGRRFEHFQPHRKGDPESPLSDAELNDKFYELTSPVIGRQAAAQLLDQLWNMEKLQVADLQLAALKNLEPLQLQQTAG